MSLPTVTTLANNPAYNVSADQWNAVVNAVKNQPYTYLIYSEVVGDTTYYYAKSGVTGQIMETSTNAGLIIQNTINTAIAVGGGTIMFAKGLYDVSSMSFQNIDYTGGINQAQIIIPGVPSNYPTGAPTVNINLVAATPTRGGWEEYMPWGLTSGGVTILSQASRLGGEYIGWLFGVQAIQPDAVNDLAVGASSNINLHINGIHFQTTPTGINAFNSFFAGTCNIGTMYVDTYFTSGTNPSQTNIGVGVNFGANGIQSGLGGNIGLLYVAGFANGLITSDGHVTISKYVSQQNSVGLRVQGGGYSFEMGTYAAQLTPILIQSTAQATIIIDHIALGDGQNLTIDANNGGVASIIIGSVVPDGAVTATPIITNFNVAGTTVTVDHFLTNQRDPPVSLKCVSGAAVGYWHLNEGAGIYAVDSSGYGNLGTLSESDTNWVSGFNGEGLYISGSSGEVTIPNTASLQMGTSDFTICAWIKAGISTYGRIVDKDGGVFSGGYAFFVVPETGELGVMVDSLYNTVRSSTNVCDNTLHFVAVVVNRDGNATFYVDGVSDGVFDVSSAASVALNNTLPLLIGNGGDSQFNGIISGIQIYKSCLSGSQIQSLYYLGM